MDSRTKRAFRLFDQGFSDLSPKVKALGFTYSTRKTLYTRWKKEHQQSSSAKVHINPDMLSDDSNILPEEIKNLLSKFGEIVESEFAKASSNRFDVCPPLTWISAKGYFLFTCSHCGAIYKMEHVISEIHDMRGGQKVSRCAHNAEIVGSSPTPATRP